MSTNVKAGGAAVKKKKRIASLDARKARAGWWFVMPFILGFVILYLPIITDSIKYSFHELRFAGGNGFTMVWAGFDNYSKALFEDPQFLQTLIAGLKQLALDIPAIVIFSLFVAILLNGKIAGRAAFRAIFFIPVLLTTGLIAQIDAQNILASMQSGGGIDDGSGSNAVSEIISVMDIQFLFDNMMIGTELVDYVVGLVNNIFNIINRSGVQMLIFLSGLQSISPAIYESCSIDGASGWETFWKITLPMVSPMILVNTVYTVIDSFTAESNKVMTYIDKVYSSVGGDVLSSAMSWMYFALVMLIIGLVAAILSAFVFYQRRD